MTVSAAHATAFFREIAKNNAVWTIRDAGGFPAPETVEGRRAMPFWSSLRRAEMIIRNVTAYAAFEPVEITVEVFRTRWLQGLIKDGFLVGVNWSGTSATGYDMEPSAVAARLSA